MARDAGQGILLTDPPMPAGPRARTQPVAPPATSDPFGEAAVAIELRPGFPGGWFSAIFAPRAPPGADPTRYFRKLQPMTETAPKPRKGYVRCEVLLPALRYQLRPHPDEPSVCVVAVLTPDGPLTLTLHKDALAQLGTAMMLEANRMPASART
jgi:hypothetical protein